MNLPLPPRWCRRLCLHPVLWGLGAMVFVGVLPLALLAAWGVALVMPGPRRVARLLAFAWLYLGLELVVMAIALGTWLASGLGRGLQRPAFVAFHYRLAAAVVAVLVRFGSRTFALTVTRQPPVRPAEGAAPPGDRPLLVLSRHAGPGDSLLMIHQLFTWARCRPRIVLKHTLQWDPMIDLVFNRLPMAFVDPGSPRQGEAVAGIGRLAATMAPGDALLIFPEGRNVTPLHRQHAIDRLRRAGREQAARRAERIRHLMPPRPRGMQAALAARPDLDVAVVAHTGLDALASVPEIWRAVPQRKTLHLRWHTFPAARVPRERGALAAWVFAEWERMDAWVAAQAAAGRSRPA
ncbi:MAG: 1-acyl-sn-glycerol-3-phosphate acyltransferase [Burkholderiales bacterium]|nr:1-acyl-sn-glycerol-3-phosphate acyltransferase [Burkholderiales bacterium]